MPEAVADDAWLCGDFVTFVQNRGKAVIDARGASSAASAANAIIDHARDWVLGSEGATVSMGVYTTPEVAAFYGTAPGLVFSLPLITKRGGGYEVVAGLPVSDFARGKLVATEKELVEERAVALSK